MRRWLERLLFLVAAGCLGYLLYVYAEARMYQSYEDKELSTILASHSDIELRSDATLPNQPAPAPGSTVGKIDIPRLHVSAVIRAGSDEQTLRLAVGYIPGTALPGTNGNVGLAGHRDTFFRKLRNIGPGDEILLTTNAGVFKYIVQGLSVVEPTDVRVLDPIGYPALTLVTCYPFSYVGSAPHRFIVRAFLRPQQLATSTN